MNKKWLILIIVVLALMLINANKQFPFGFHYYKHQHISYPKQPLENDELHTLRKNFEINIENSNIRLDERNHTVNCVFS